MITEVTFFQEQIRSYPVLRVRGKVRMADLERWDRELQALTGRSEGSALLDLTTCSFLPSLAFPPLIRAHQTFRKQGATLHVAVEGELLQVLRYLHLDLRLAIHEGVQASLEAANAEPRPTIES